MTTNKTFSISEALNFGWETFKQNPVFWILFTLITGILGSFNSVIDVSTNPENGFGLDQYPVLVMFLGLLSLVFVVISIGIQLGTIRVELDAVDNRELKLSTIFSQFQFMKMLKYFVATFLYGLLVGVGMVLLIVPGLYFALKYQYYGYFMVDKGAGIFESGKLSAEITKGVKIKLLGFWLLGIALLIVGAVFFMVGLFVAIPVVSLGYAYLFRKLTSDSVMPQPEAQPMAPAAPEMSQPQQVQYQADPVAQPLV